VRFLAGWRIRSSCQDYRRLSRLEHDIANYRNNHTFIDHRLDFRGDQLFLSGRPGLGVDLDVELLEAKSVYRRPGS
jgi:hypothetical protein